VQAAVIDGGACEGRTVLVMGCGPVGLAAALAARESGARVLIAGVAEDDQRLAAGAALGAEVLTADSGTLPPQVEAATGGRSADLVLDVTGDSSGQVAAAAVACAAIGGTVILGGMGNMALPVGEIRKKGLVLKFLRGHSFAALRQGVGLLQRHALRLGALSGPVFALAEVDAGLRAVRANGPEIRHACIRL
jgi:threonine dehydrogenase-like Zn-dependent dehydrogenase